MGSIVYHYTSPQGAFDILRNKKLWFTDCQYLNDVGEFVYIREPLKEAYEKISREHGENTEGIDDFLKTLYASPYEGLDFEIKCRREIKGKGIKISFPPRFRYYVLCASTNADTANMWNYYVKDGAYRGYNLGLDSNVICKWFSQLANDQIKLVSGDVIYNHQKQVKMIYDELKILYSQFDTMKSQIGDDGDDCPVIEKFQDGLFELISHHKLFFKNPAFESEKEYRFVLKVHNDFFDNTNHVNLKADYRMGASGIVTPYVEWRFGNIKSEILKQITLSPTMEPGLAEDGLKRFLDEDVYRSIKIEQSRIKLRF